MNLLLLLALVAGQADAKAAAATVNGEAIAIAEVDRAVGCRPKGSAPLPSSLANDLRRAALDDLIDERLVAQFLTGQKIVVTDDEVATQMKVLKESLAKRGSSLDAYRRETGLTDAELREQFRTLIGFEKFAETTGTPDELRRFYELYKEHFDGVTVDAEALLVRVPRTATTAERAKLLEKATAIARECRVAEGVYELHAKSIPYHPGTARLGRVTRFDSLVDDAVAKAAFSLPVKGISDPVEVRGGYAIVRAIGRSEPKPRPFDEIQDWVKETYAGSLRSVVIGRQRQKAKIEIHVP
jgi:parvulin-like peptidyl-prolyl isomerase